MPRTAAKSTKSVTKPAKTESKQAKTEIKPPKTETPSDPGHFSISALARKFKLDRATVRERLEKAEIKPVSTKAREKLYLLEDVQFVLSQSEMNEAKFRKIDAEAELKALELRIKSGEYGSVAEFTEITQKIFSRLYKKIAVQLPARIATRLHNANSSAEVVDILKKELGNEFNDLRTDFSRYL